jgi:hypothetical protein
LRFRKKPVVIQAVQFLGHGNLQECLNFLGPVAAGGDTVERISINTLEGIMTARPLDWIIKGVKGEFYPCKPDIFEATYERVGED